MMVYRGVLKFSLVCFSLLVGTVSSFAVNSYVATLLGSNENPAVPTSSYGLAIVTLSDDETTADYRLNVFNMQNVTAAHIHLGAVGVNGGVIHPLDTPATGSSSGSLTFSATDVSNLKAGLFYVNVHTTANPGGAIRGQLLDRPINFEAVLMGSTEVPQVKNTPGTGFTRATLSDDLGTLSWTVTVNNLQNVTAAHFHQAAAGVSGGVVIPIASGSFTETSGSAAVDSALLDALLSEGLYVNVHTTQNAPGEIRGQVKHLIGADNDKALVRTSGVPVPTMSEWGMIVMTLLLVAFGVTAILRRQRAYSV